MAEVICKNCMDEGVDPSTDFQRKSSNCCCGVFDRKFAFRKNLADQKNRRLLQFSNFNDNASDAMDLDDDDNDGGGNPALDGFLDFLLISGSQMTKTYAIAHNSGKYDLHILLERMYARQLTPKMTLNGKILKFSVKFPKIY